MVANVTEAALCPPQTGVYPPRYDISTYAPALNVSGSRPPVGGRLVNRVHTRQASVQPRGKTQSLHRSELFAPGLLPVREVLKEELKKGTVSIKRIGALVRICFED